jgi:DNA-binding transcriptional LysR family regulator
MDYRDSVFLLVAANLSFSKAAEELFISQPAVTRLIKELEERYNIALFERKGNRIYLTKAGEKTYGYLKKIEQQYHELEFELGRLNDTFKGSLRIGASSTISQYVIPEVIASFHKCYHDIEFFLFNGNSFEMEKQLLSNEIDLALVENESSQSNIHYIPFLDDEIVVVTGQKSIYAKRKNISIADFQQIPIVLREKGSGTLEVIQRALLKQGIKMEMLNILIHLGSTESIKNFLSGFDGIALISEKAIRNELFSGQLVQLSVKNMQIDRKFRIALRQGPVTLMPKLFIDFLSGYNI